MRFYLVRHHTEGGCSAGFSWHTNKAKARSQVAQINRDEPIEADHSEVVGPIDIDPSKAGILHALSVWACHPDNG